MAEDDGVLLEFPLQERHHRIISTFMAEMAQHHRDPSRDSPGTSANRLPTSGVLQELAAWLRTWWTQRVQRKGSP